MRLRSGESRMKLEGGLKRYSLGQKIAIVVRTL
jgi:hypothetical protein